VVVTRPATIKDVPYIESVFLDAARPHITRDRGWDERREIEAFWKQLDLSCTRVIVSSHADVGFVTVYEHDAEIEIHALCIAPEHQCRGLGTAVIQQVVRDSTSRHRSLALSVLKVNTRARSLYERIGFVTYGESERHHRMRYQGDVEVSRRS
jgi:ribosomal protein S18 acetylase RimI-like enzyme